MSLPATVEELRARLRAAESSYSLARVEVDDAERAFGYAKLRKFEAGQRVGRVRAALDEALVEAESAQS